MSEWVSRLISRHYIVALFVVALFFVVTQAFASPELPLYQWTLIAAVALVAVVGFLLLERPTPGQAAPVSRGRLWVTAVVAYIVTTAVLYYPTWDNIFRVDYWAFAIAVERSNLQPLDFIRDIILFEYLGHVRFQPLSHLVMFLRHLAFGNNVYLYHALNMVVHVACGLLVCVAAYRASGRAGLSYLAGLLFLSFVSQFDTVAWTYHVYIPLSTAILIFAMALSQGYSRMKEEKRFFLAMCLALTAGLFYEAALPGAVAVGLAFWGRWRENGTLGKGRIRLLILTVAASYALYAGVSVFVLSFTDRADVVTPAMIFGAGNIFKGVKSVLMDLAHTFVLINSGGEIVVRITSNAEVWGKELLSVSGAPRVLLFALLLVLALPGTLALRQRRYFIAALVFMALSYLFIIALGRSFTNEWTYLLITPRYKYLPNAMFLVGLASFGWAGYSDRRMRLVSLAIIIALFVWNAQNTMYANNKVSAALEEGNEHYRNFREFVAQHPDKKVFVRFTPESEREFSWRSDLALNVLFKDSVTWYVNSADYIYDQGGVFRKNYLRDRTSDNQLLEDFTIRFDYEYPLNTMDLKYFFEKGGEACVIGSLDSLPRVCITNEYVSVTLRNLINGAPEIFRLRYAPQNSAEPGEKARGWIAIEKYGADLCVLYGGEMKDSVRLAYPYGQWKKDNLQLLGDHYIGMQNLPLTLSGLYVQLGQSLFGCQSF